MFRKIREKKFNQNQVIFMPESPQLDQMKEILTDISVMNFRLFFAVRSFTVRTANDAETGSDYNEKKTAKRGPRRNPPLHFHGNNRESKIAT